MCAPGPTGQAVTGFATRKIQAIRQGAFTRRRTDIPKICLIFAMEKRRLGVMKTAQVEKNLKCKCCSYLMFVQNHLSWDPGKTQMSALRAANFAKRELVRKSILEHLAKTPL